MAHACGRPVVQKNGAGEVIARYDSTTLAAEAVGGAAQNISSAIKRGGTSAGFYWEDAT